MSESEWCSQGELALERALRWMKEETLMLVLCLVELAWYYLDLGLPKVMGYFLLGMLTQELLAA